MQRAVVKPVRHPLSGNLRNLCRKQGRTLLRCHRPCHGFPPRNPAPNRALKRQSDRLPAGRLLPIRGTGLPLWAGPGNAARFPARAERFPADRQVQSHRQASARPGGREAPAGGGAGAGRGSAWRCGRGDGPCHGSGAGGSDSDLPPPVRAGKGNACVSPPARNAATSTPATRTDRGQRPARRARSARRGRGGRWPGALGPRRA